MKLTLSSYSLIKLIRDGKARNVAELVPYAKKLGFEGFEVVTIPEGTEKLANEIKAAVDSEGLTLTSMCVGADFLANPVAEQVGKLKPMLDAAAVMGIPLMRHDATGGIPKDWQGVRSFDAALPRLAEGYARVTEYAKTLGIKTCVENHGYFCQDSERVVKLINTVNDANFGALVDTGNFLCADEDPIHAVSAVAPLAFHAHAKDFHIKYGGKNPGLGWFGTRGGNWLRGAIAGHGCLPLAQLLGILKRAGYDGWVAVEFEGIEDCLVGCEESKKNLEAIIEGIR